MSDFSLLNMRGGIFSTGFSSFVLFGLRVSRGDSLGYNVRVSHAAFPTQSRKSRFLGLALFPLALSAALSGGQR